MKHPIRNLVVSLAVLFGADVLAESNPAAPRFDASGSDPRTIEIADEVMAALGGREAWDSTRFITWRFFGRRLHVWDKQTGNIRVEWKDRETQKAHTVLMNLHTKEGRGWVDGEALTDGERLDKVLHRAEGAWINDSYWLVMPYKLKDTGVTIKYLGERENETGILCDVLELTFKDVGRTPQNRYHVFVDKSSRLVTHWDYWKDASVEEPRSLGPWRNWRSYGSIMLADDHGSRKHTDIAVLETLPESVFTSSAPFVLADHQ